MIKKVCVFCASSKQIAKDYLDAAFNVGRILASQNITIVYGGGYVGSMGELAKSVIENKGCIIGIIPKFMIEMEWGNPHITEMIVVETIAQRKKKLIENVDAVIALPGGTGTLEELSEIISLKKLCLFTKPIIILNTNGFYNHLLLFLEQMISENFIRPEHRQLFEVALNPEEIIEKIEKSPKWESSAINLAAL